MSNLHLPSFVVVKYLLIVVFSYLLKVSLQFQLPFHLVSLMICYQQTVYACRVSHVGKFVRLSRYYALCR